MSVSEHSSKISHEKLQGEGEGEGLKPRATSTGGREQLSPLRDCMT